MAREPLDVWLYGTKVAILSEQRARVTMRWLPDAAHRWPINSTVMSVLLPIAPSQQPNPGRVRAFFGGLMPEGDARVQLAFEAGIDRDDLLGMMRHYGRDVAGALVIQAEGSDPPVEVGHLKRIDRDAISEKLARADSNAAPLGVVPGINSLSLAGMQPKIALHRDAVGAWFECLDGAASTHIIKPGRDGEISDLIWNEAFSLRTARRLGLTTIDAWVETFAGRDALVVSRYDRQVGGGGLVARIHQEDCAQALGINPDDPARKFQYGKALPSLQAIAAVMSREFAPRRPLLELTAFNVAIGNTDAHAKNISMLHDEDGQMSLAPAYDVSPHRHYSSAGRRSAMDINGVHDIDAVTGADLITEAEMWGFTRVRAAAIVTSLLERLRAELHAVDEADRVGVPDPVVEVMAARTINLLGTC